MGCIVVDLVACKSFNDLSWYLKLGCKSVDLHSCPLCSHSQAGAVMVTLRQGTGDPREELFKHYRHVSIQYRASVHAMLDAAVYWEKMTSFVPVGIFEEWMQILNVDWNMKTGWWRYTQHKHTHNAMWIPVG